MPSFFQSFGRGSGTSSDGPTTAAEIAQKPRRENRQTPPLSLVRAELEPERSKVFVGQLWDISLSGAALSLGRVVFPHLPESGVILRLLSRHGPDVLELPATIRWIDVNHGVTFTGLLFGEKIKAGTFLDSFLDFS